MQTSTLGLTSCAVSLSLFSATKPSGVTTVKVCSSGLWPVPHVQETCCERLTTAPFIRGIVAVFLAIAFRVFFPHALSVAASEHVSRAAPCRQQGLSHLCLLQPSQQLPPRFPRGQPPWCPCHSAPWQCQSPCGMEPGAELQLLLSLRGKGVQGPGSPGYELDGAQMPLLSAARPPVRRRLQARLQSAATELGQMVLPAAWHLPDFSPGLWGETSLGPVTKWKEWESVRVSQHRSCMFYSPAGCWGDPRCRETFPRAVAVSCHPGGRSKAEAIARLLPKAKGCLCTFELHKAPRDPETLPVVAGSAEGAAEEPTPPCFPGTRGFFLYLLDLESYGHMQLNSHGRKGEFLVR